MLIVSEEAKHSMEGLVSGNTEKGRVLRSFQTLWTNLMCIAWRIVLMKPRWAALLELKTPVTHHVFKAIRAADDLGIRNGHCTKTQMK